MLWVGSSAVFCCDPTNEYYVKLFTWNITFFAEKRGLCLWYILANSLDADKEHSEEMDIDLDLPSLLRYSR